MFIILFKSKMGESCSFPVLMNKDIHIPHLKERNSYGYTQDLLDDKIIMAVFPQNSDQNGKSKVISLIQNHRSQLFQDEKFKMNEEQALRLSVLFNFKTNRTRIYTKKQETDITSFIQLNIEFSYLTSVFYLLSRKEAKAKLLPRFIQTQQTNHYGAYSTELFCNGQPHQVIIDDRMVISKDNFVYLRIVKGIELWPLILQKAWCKQIGSYKLALGLSPEDAFEEITGIPAYTYTIKASNRAVIKNVLASAIGKGHWVTLIARNGLVDLTNRQVFYLQSIHDDQYVIISPYVSYSFQNSKTNRRGEVTVRQDDIFSHFEHVVVGFYKQNYAPISLPVSSKSRQELVFEINVTNREEISIRFNQFYHGYLSTTDRAYYQYSPVMIELYSVTQVYGAKKSYNIVDYWQGCSRSLAGARSAQCSANILQALQGKYLLRLQVGWNNEEIINKGNLVIYSSKGNVQISQLNDTSILLNEVYPRIFQKSAANSIILHQHSLQVDTFDKEKSTLIRFHNVTNNVNHFQADFGRSKNIKLRGKQVKGNYAYLRMQPDQKEIIEVLPLNMKQNIEIQNFEMLKIPIKL